MLIELVMCHPKPHDYTADPLCVGHWWLSLSAADQGAWLSGVASFAAAGVAVFIALWSVYREKRKEDRAKKSREIILANYFYIPLSNLSHILEKYAVEFRKVAEFGNHELVRHRLHEAEQELKTLGPLGIEDHLEKLVDFPPDFGGRIATLPAQINDVRSRIEGAKYDPLGSYDAIDRFLKKANFIADEMHGIKELVDAFLGRYSQTFVG